MSIVLSILENNVRVKTLEAHFQPTQNLWNCHLQTQRGGPIVPCVVGPVSMKSLVRYYFLIDAEEQPEIKLLYTTFGYEPSFTIEPDASNDDIDDLADLLSDALDVLDDFIHNR